MTVTVKLFARARDLAGVGTIELELPESSTVDSVRTVLFTRYPTLAAMASTLLLAVDGQYATKETVLSPGCEIACFPPVSGG